MNMKRNKPSIAVTHTETLSYALCYVWEKYKENENQADKAEEAGNKDLAEAIRGNTMWKDKGCALCFLYEMETGTEHEFKDSFNK